MPIINNEMFLKILIFIFTILYLVYIDVYKYVVTKLNSVGLVEQFFKLLQRKCSLNRFILITDSWLHNT